MIRRLSYELDEDTVLNSYYSAIIISKSNEHHKHKLVSQYQKRKLFFMKKLFCTILEVFFMRFDGLILAPTKNLCCSLSFPGNWKVFERSRSVFSHFLNVDFWSYFRIAYLLIEFMKKMKKLTYSEKSKGKKTC
jgi:hypothetical protein